MELLIEFVKCIGVFVLVFCIVVGFGYIAFGKEQFIMGECKRIGDDNTRRSMEKIKKNHEEWERVHEKESNKEE